MASPKLIPGSFVTRSGVYRVVHSTGHMPDSECVLIKGILLPSCTVAECHVIYDFLREERDAQRKYAEQLKEQINRLHDRVENSRQAGSDRGPRSTK